MFTTIICDIGGVLITSAEKVTPYILSQMYSIPVENALIQYKNALPNLQKGALSVESFASTIGSEYPPKMIIPDIKEVYLEYYQKQALINEEMLLLLEEVSKTYRLVAFSNMMDLHVRCNRNRGLFRNFHKVYISSETGMVKPDQVAFDFILEDLHVNARECIFIDDQQKNIDVALAVGMFTYLFDSTEKLFAFFQKNGVL
jgi:glucose-1-phosphatase